MPFDFTIKKLPHLAALFFYNLQLIHHVVWITELQYNACVEEKQFYKWIMQKHLSKTCKNWPLSKDIFLTQIFQALEMSS